MSDSKYQRWMRREDSLIIQKYSGDIDFNSILENDSEFLAEANPVRQLLNLADISEATFPSIDYKDIGDLFAYMDKYVEKTEGMKIAIYTGSNQFEDFKKASEYARLGGSRPISIIAFNFLDMAMNWLGMSDEEQEEAEKLLRKG